MVLRRRESWGTVTVVTVSVTWIATASPADSESSAAATIGPCRLSAGAVVRASV
jgi:hypothetical protein